MIAVSAVSALGGHTFILLGYVLTWLSAFYIVYYTLHTIHYIVHMYILYIPAGMPTTGYYIQAIYQFLDLFPAESGCKAEPDRSMPWMDS